MRANLEFYEAGTCADGKVFVLKEAYVDAWTLGHLAVACGVEDFVAFGTKVLAMMKRHRESSALMPLTAFVGDAQGNANDKNHSKVKEWEGPDGAVLVGKAMENLALQFWTYKTSTVARNKRDPAPLPADTKPHVPRKFKDKERTPGKDPNGKRRKLDPSPQEPEEPEDSNGNTGATPWNPYNAFWDGYGDGQGGDQGGSSSRG
jgi:hypothetical protein